MANTATSRYGFIPVVHLQLGIVIFGLTIAFLVTTHKLMDGKVGLWPLYFLSLLQLTPIIICTIRKKFNYIAFILSNHFFSYSLYKFNHFHSVMHSSYIYPETLRAIEELTICTFLTLAAYFAARFLLPSKGSNEPYQLLSLKRWQLVTISLYVILVPFFLSYIPSWYIAVHYTIMGADIILLLSSNSPGHERLATLMKALTFVSAIVYFVYTGMLTLVGILAAYIFIAACIRRKVTFFLMPVVLTIIGSAIQTVKFDYRSAIQGHPESSLVDRFALLSALLQEKYVGGLDTSQSDPDGEDVDDKLLSGYSRVGDDSLERVLDWTPRKVPYWNGETYAHIPYIFIPRVLWPDKPSRHMWHKFGHVYGYLSEDDHQTSVGVSYLAEAYMNFGSTGMYTVAFFFGMFIWLIEAMSYVLLKGNFAFSFMVFLIPLQWFAADLGTIVNSVLIETVVILIFRNQILGMARHDVYSTKLTN